MQQLSWPGCNYLRKALGVMRLWNVEFLKLFFCLCCRSHCEGLWSVSVTHQGGSAGHGPDAFHLRRTGTASCFPMDALISMNTNMHLAQTKMWTDAHYCSARTRECKHSLREHGGTQAQIHFPRHMSFVHSTPLRQKGAKERRAPTLLIVFI